MRRSRRILLLSAYRADSHAWWADWLQSAFPDVDWQVLELPGRHFRWRIRGNPLSWLEPMEAALANADAVLATSMVDLATLRGLFPALTRIPNLYYFHENQFAYPTRAQQIRSLEPQMVQLYGALAADEVLFNSQWNRDSFLAGVDALLERMPDAVPKALSARLAAKSQVIPVPLKPIKLNGAIVRDEQLIVWNHRWEYDKAPEVFAEALELLAKRGVDFRLALLGSRPVTTPHALMTVQTQFDPVIVANAHLPRADYERTLSQAAIAVSTAIHEFQGLAMLEAASAGAVPLVPDTLVYPEHFALAYRYQASNTQALAERLAHWLDRERPKAPDVSAWEPAILTPQWAKALGI